MKKMKKPFAIMLALIMVLAFIPAAAMAAEDPYYGKNYDHIDVKVDGKYNISVDGTPYTLDGILQSNSIEVQIGSTTYDFSKYQVEQQTESGRREYEINVNELSPSSIEWVQGTYKMNNVYVSARMLFSDVPEILKKILPTITVGEINYYYADIENMKYTGVQECTRGNGMRSEGNTGTPTGLDLYITAEGIGVYITKGKLAIEKIIVNEDGTVIEDKTPFSFTITGNGNSNAYSKTVEVKGGETVTLTDLPAGTYTITESQRKGYAIRAIDGEPTNNYSKDYVVVVKQDTEIPVAQFTNTKLNEKSSINIKKTASGAETGVVYPDPSVSIYAANEQGDKIGEALWSGSLKANGDTLYPTVYFEAGRYVVEETGEGIDGYECTTTLTVNNQPAQNKTFTVTEAGETFALVINNTYTAKTESDPETVTISIPIYKEVGQGGNTAPGKQTFTFVLSDFGADDAASQVTVANNTIETNGAGYYETVMTVTIDKNNNNIGNLSEGFKVTERNDGAPYWAYDATEWYVVPKMNNDQSTYCTFYNLTAGDKPWEIQTHYNGISFTNIYTYNYNGGYNPTPVRPVQPAPLPPQTGDMPLWYAVAQFLGLVK